jgi:hypothetical protein
MNETYGLGETVTITPGTYHGAKRPAHATVTGEGSKSDTYKVISGGWHMTYHTSELSRPSNI